MVVSNTVALASVEEVVVALASGEEIVVDNLSEGATIAELRTQLHQQRPLDIMEVYQLAAGDDVAAETETVDRKSYSAIIQRRQVDMRLQHCLEVSPTDETIYEILIKPDESSNGAIDRFADCNSRRLCARNFLQDILQNDFPYAYEQATIGQKAILEGLFGPGVDARYCREEETCRQFGDASLSSRRSSHCKVTGVVDGHVVVGQRWKL